MKWTIDPSHSSIEFTVKHMALTSVRGRFTKFIGEGHTNAQGVIESLRIVIETESLYTAEDQRDAHLRSADFFDAARFPQIVFESTSVQATAHDRYDVQGNLTMHGVTKPLNFILTTTNPIRDVWGSIRVGGQSQGTLQRKDWGLTWNQLMDFGGMVISDEVWFNVSVQAIPESEPEYRVRWALATGQDDYQVVLRYNRLRAQAKLSGVNGWLEVLNGRPTSLEAEFPLAQLQINGASALLPQAVAALMGSQDQVHVRVPAFDAPRPGVFLGTGEVQFGVHKVPVEVEVENVNLPSGSSSFLTARLELRVPQAALTQFAAERRLGGLTQGNGLQATLWFMSRVEQKQTEMLAQV